MKLEHVGQLVCSKGLGEHLEEVRSVEGAR